MTKICGGEVVGHLGPPRRTIKSFLSRDRGSVLLETAIAIPMLFGVAMSLIWALGVATTALSLGDVARESARAIARGESLEVIARKANEQAPKAQVNINQGADSVLVELTQHVALPLPMLEGLGLKVHRSAVVARENLSW
ncbi:MAG: TadE family type IV pilus minor pilin [Actinomycetota bacterium]|nr:TadE family type IV pilus minor pilin [Actinomycetota bacterium]